MMFVSASLLASVAVAVFGYALTVAAYRLWLSPLAAFPGPKLAALSKWYEAYYEIVLKGKFTFHIQDLHRKYGPIVRVTPDELHIQDPPFWETLYVKHNKSYKAEWGSGRFGNNASIFTTSDPTLHKLRRAPLNGMFSRRAIIGLESVVHSKMQIFVDGLAKFYESGAACKISEAYSAFAGDVITSYCFSYSYDHLKLDGFSDSFHDAFMAVSEFGHVAVQFPWMHPILNSLPDSWNKAMNPPLAKLLDLQRDLRIKIQGVRDDLTQGHKQPEHPTIFHTLLQSDLPDSEKSNLRLGQEAQLFLGAGIETTAWSLSTATFYILSNPEVLSRLKQELREAIPDCRQEDAFNFVKLEALPYLRGCVKEGVRLALNVSARNQRWMETPIVWREWTIPAKTEISMTIADVHLNGDYFPEPNNFKPERWLGESPKAPDGSPLERYFVAFGKGPRSCLGINLAYMELFVAIGTIFRRFNLELYETDISDVLCAHDFFLPSPKLDSKGVRARVVSLEA